MVVLQICASDGKYLVLQCLTSLSYVYYPIIHKSESHKQTCLAAKPQSLSIMLYCFQV